MNIFTKSLIIIGAMLIGQVASAAENLSVAVASNFLFPLKQLKNAFEEEHSVQIQIISASSAKLYSQIKQGAPFDVFLSADKKTVDRLIEDSLVERDMVFPYARGELVFWSPGTINPEQILREKPFLRMVIANPKFAPYGLAAEEVLSHYPANRSLIYAENVAQAFQYVFYGTVAAGFVAHSQLLAKNITTDYWLIPLVNYQPIIQYGAIVNAARNKANAKKFMQYMTSENVRQRLINELGYAPLN